MKVDPILQSHIKTAFELVSARAAAVAFPSPSAFSKALEKSIPAKPTSSSVIYINRDTARMFTTAAVNVWLRGVHSFLISASLTNVSPIWASVAGYYSSHYSVRAIAHLLGYYQLFSRKRIVHLDFDGSRYCCSFIQKNSGDREHRVYWRIVKQDSHFTNDPFFTDNTGVEVSDVGHRDRANYADHLSQFPVFRPLSADEVKYRIARISEIEFIAPPIPAVSKYPDLESVQIVAYHRLVRFRDLVNAVIGGSNRLWNVYKDPMWARGFIDFQLTERASLESQFTT